MTYFEGILRLHHIDPIEYLDTVKQYAKKYDPNIVVKFASDKTHKIEVITPDGKSVKIGAANYYDYIMYSIMEDMGAFLLHTAYRKRQNYLARSRKLKGEWDNKYSKNNLAMALLWDG